MSQGSTSEILLDGFGDVAVKANGAMIEVHADGSVAAHTSGDVDAYTNASVRVYPAANANEKASTTTPAALKPGDLMPDGTIYAGVSPDTHKAMYTTPADVPLTMQWKVAMKYASKVDTHGHRDWRVPTSGELNVLFNNRAAIGGFNLSGSSPAGWYWSSTEGNYNDAWSQRFSDGGQVNLGRSNDSSLRCVR